MKEEVKNSMSVTPMLFPYEPEQFWKQIREIIHEEVAHQQPDKKTPASFETNGLTYKPLYKIAEVCTLFHVTKPTIEFE